MRGEGSSKDSAVNVSTDLPPQVDGQLRCFCKLSIPKILWAVSKVPAVTFVRVKWWGEDGPGTIFRPLDGKKGKDPKCRTTARYPVRSGPMQFATYLKDMKSLVLDVLDNPKARPIGQATVSGLSQLSTSKGIERKLPVVSSSGQKLADLDVSLVLEHLMASFDCNGSIPTSDGNTGRPEASCKPKSAHSLYPNQSSNNAQFSVKEYDSCNTVAEQPKSNNDAVAITADGDVVSLPMYSGQRVFADANVGIGSRPQSRNAGNAGGKDLLSMLVDRGKMLRDAMAVSAIHTDQATKHSSPPDDFSWDPSLVNSPVRNDYDASLLINSAAPSPHRAINMMMESPPIKRQDLQLYKFVTNGSPGSSLSSDFGLDHVMSELEDPNHEHSILQDLFYNETDIEAIQVGEGMIPSNLFHANIPGLSPLHNGYLTIPSAVDLPTNLSSSIAVDDPGNQRPSSRASSMTSLNLEDDKVDAGKKKKVKRKARSRSLSNSRSRSRSRSVTPSRPSEIKSRKDGNKESSKDRSPSNLHKPKKKVKSRSRARERLMAGRKKAEGDSTGVSDASFVSEALSQKSDVDGLSVERLTLLGRAHYARVNVDILNLNKSSVWDLSSFFSDHLKTSKLKKSPKLKKPCAFFVEYQFPVVATSKDKYTPHAIATEVTRVASRNIKNGAVSFGHRSVYPIMFDGSMLERWWKSALIFRLYAREAGQNSPCLIGSGGISLKSILKSDNLFVKREVEIPDASYDGLLNSSRSSINTTINSRSGVTIFGHLKISVELASDHKEFATVMARTKLSELSGNAKIVPLGAGVRRDKEQLVKQLNKNEDVPIVKSPVKKIDFPIVHQESVSHNNPGIVGLPPQSPRRKGVDAAQTVTNQSPGEDEDEIGMLKKQLKGLIGNMAVSAQNVNDNTPASFPPNVEASTLHLLLYIEEGRNLSITGIPPLHMANQQPALMQRQTYGNKTLSRNSFLACRMFWCNDVIHSHVCWNSLNPQFDFLQMSSVSLNSSLMERMKDNYMIVEVWDQQAGTTSDKLVGLVKLSLHQFYLSFRDRKIGNALLKSQYPVMAIDNYMPIIDLFSGLYFGQLKVVLAMGSQQQISALQQAVVSGMQSNGPTPRSHPAQNGIDPMAMLPAQGQVDHHFEIKVEGVRGLKVFEKMIYGEADCFVQFFFPSHGEARDNGGMIDMKSLSRMKCFRTATTLCIPDPVFNDSTQVKLTLPVGKPVQPELLIACSNPREQGKGLPFEVWCRYYHPNVRDQRIAQGMLPIAKLCAMVTMHRPSHPCAQSFTIHLSQVTAFDGKYDLAEGKNTGLMDVAIRYSSQTAQGEESGLARSRNIPNSQVCLTVEIIRAAGLKAAAECAAQSDSSMAFCADVGVNPYIRVRLPFLGKENERITKTIARCFTPDFSQSMDFPCSLSLSNNASSSRTTSLAELLEGSDAIFEVWHQTSGQSQSDARMEEEMYLNGPIYSQGDVLLGTCSVPLLSLLTHTTGVHGWFPITQPQLSWSKPSKEDRLGPKNQVLGGLELSLRFADLHDRDSVVSVGRELGWSPLHMESGLSNQREEGHGQMTHRITIGVELASFPSTSATKAGYSDLEPSSLCYVCYKLYDQGVTISKSRKIHPSELGALQSYISHKNEFGLFHNPDLKRYLQEKRLEIQVWVTYSNEKKGEKRPRQGDRLIGSCYIDLDSLLDTRKKEQQISGSFPLFNGSSPSLKSAFIRANIVSSIQHQTLENQISDVDGSLMDTDQVSESDSTLTLEGDIHVQKSPKKKRKGRKSGDLEASFSVVLALERAMHLPMVSDRNRSSEVRPTTYVSYQSAERSNPSHTTIFPNSCNPLWDYAVETRLSKEYLYKQNKNLVLKVWHKPSDASKSPDKSSDRVLGFVSVDLSPLSKSLNQLCGWYNIIDFTGQCRGQIKVSITPQDLTPAEGASDTNISSFGMTSLPTAALSMTNTQTATSTIAQQLQQLQHQVMARMGSLSRNLAGDETTSTNPVSVNNYQNLDTSEDLMTTGTLSTNHPTPRPYHPFSTTSSTQPDSARDESSKSLLFSTLRRQLADLDKVMEGFKDRAGPVTTIHEHHHSHLLQPADNEKSGDIIYGSQSELSTIHTASSLMNTRESSAPSRINNNSSTEVVTSQEMQQDNHAENERGNNMKIVSKDPKGKLSDSGVFSAKNCSEGVKSGEEYMENGHMDKNMILTLSDNQSTLQSILDGNLPVLEEVIPSPDDTSEKTQPFVINASNSEGSQISQGFPLHRSNNHGSPSKSDSTAKSVSVKKNSCPVNEGSHSSGSKTHLENLGEEVSYDDSDTEEEKKFGSYRRYRDLLDAEEEEDDSNDEEEEGEGNRVEIVPRNLNISPVLPDAITPENIGSPVINSSGQDFNEINMVGVDMGSHSLLEESSPARNVHEGTSVWYSEEEDREGVDQFQEVFERNQRLLRERNEGGDNNGDDLGEWLMIEKEVLANQNVEEWLVHRSHDNDNDDWLGFEGVQRTNGSSLITPRDVVRDQRSDDVVDHYEMTALLKSDGEKMKPKQGGGEEMKLMLDDDDSDHEFDEGERKNLFYSSDEDTYRNEEDTQEKRNADIDDFLAVESEGHVEVTNGLHSLKIQDNIVSPLQDVVLNNDLEFSPDTNPIAWSMGEEAETHFSTAVSNVQFDSPRNHTGQGARPKVRHLLSNVELNSETSNSGSRRNSKGSAVSIASQNGMNIQSLDYHRESFEDIDSEEETELTKVKESCNRLPSENLEYVSDLDNLNNSPRVSKDVNEHQIEHTVEENGEEKIYSREGRNERKGVNDRNSTMDSAFVDGECSEGHTTTVNSSAVTGGHMSYVEDSGVEPSADMNFGMGQGHRVISNGGIEKGIPNFFMDTEELQGSISALQMATAAANNVIQRDAKYKTKVKAVSDLVQKIADSKTRTKPALAKAKLPPSSDQTKRIAKIFSSKPS